MGILNDTPSFSANEVIAVAATDLLEGAASGASFGGIGRSNQQAQQLANRTSFLKGRQDTNIGNIAALLAFIAGFKGSMGPNGYLAIPFVDISRGPLIALVQWGLFTGTLSNGGNYSVSWPTAFTAAPFFATAILLNSSGEPSRDLVMEIVSLSAVGAVFESNWTGVSTTRPIEDGFYYLGIGF